MGRVVQLACSANLWSRRRPEATSAPLQLEKATRLQIGSTRPSRITKLFWRIMSCRAILGCPPLYSEIDPSAKAWICPRCQPAPWQSGSTPKSSPPATTKSLTSTCSSKLISQQAGNRGRARDTAMWILRHRARRPSMGRSRVRFRVPAGTPASVRRSSWSPLSIEPVGRCGRNDRVWMLSRDACLPGHLLR